MDAKNIIFFRSKSELRAWFKKNHKTNKELWAGFYKKNSGMGSVTYRESVDTALCFGWIDGIRKSIDEISYTIRFTPRNPNSSWSVVNIKKIEELKNLGLMESAGLEVYKKRREDRSGVYSFEQEKVVLEEKYEKIFRKNRKAWKYFESEVPSYKRPAIHWIQSAKREETKLRRLEILIRNSAMEEKIPLLRRVKS